MKPALKTLIGLAVTASAISLAVAALLFPPPADFRIRDLVFWTVVALLASHAPVRLPTGVLLAVATGPILACSFLAGPLAAGLVAALGTTEIREVRGRVPWYGTAYNHALAILPAVSAGALYQQLAGAGAFEATPRSLIAATAAGTLFFLANSTMAAAALALRQERSFRSVYIASWSTSGVAAGTLALAPLAWLVAHVYATVDWWAALLFGLPLLTTRAAYQRVVELRDMFTQTVRSLASAVDAKDKFTSGHSERVQRIAVDIGRQMRCSESELEALEWGGLLHDIGKIGVPDAVLLKQDRLTKEERILMNQHPVKGEEIIKPVQKLAPELPIIRHHHEWYNGSGYPDHLVGEEIPKLARILHVADAFEAMTAARPYRMSPLTPAQAMAEIRRYTGIQFDPVAVDAFSKTRWAAGIQDPGRPTEERVVPMLGQVAASRAGQAGREPGLGTKSH